MELDIKRKFDFHFIVMTTGKMLLLVKCGFCKSNKYEGQNIKALQADIPKETLE